MAGTWPQGAFLRFRTWSASMGWRRSMGDTALQEIVERLAWVCLCWAAWPSGDAQGRTRHSGCGHGILAATTRLWRGRPEGPRGRGWDDVGPVGPPGGSRGAASTAIRQEPEGTIARGPWCDRVARRPLPPATWAEPLLPPSGRQRRSLQATQRGDALDARAPSHHHPSSDAKVLFGQLRHGLPDDQGHHRRTVLEGHRSVRRSPSSAARLRPWESWGRGRSQNSGGTAPPPLRRTRRAAAAPDGHPPPHPLPAR